jgi:hypothetical protein
MARIHHFAKKNVSNYMVTLQLLENFAKQWTYFKEKQYAFTNIFGKIELILAFLFKIVIFSSKVIEIRLHVVRFMIFFYYLFCSQIWPNLVVVNRHFCRNPSFGLTTKARGCKEAREQRQTHWKGAGQEEEARESSHTPGSLRKCEGV